MREEGRRKKEERRTRRPKQVLFHNRTHKNFLSVACVETPHSDFSSCRRASAITLKWCLSSVDTLWIPLLRRAVCSLALSSAHSAIHVSFLGYVCPSFRSITVWYGSLLDLFRSSTYPLVSFKKPCTKDCPLLRQIDTLRSGPHVIDNIFRKNVYTRLSLSHYVDVFQWDRECFMIPIVKASIEIPHDVDKQNLHT